MLIFKNQTQIGNESFKNSPWTKTLEKVFKTSLKPYKKAHKIKLKFFVLKSFFKFFKTKREKILIKLILEINQLLLKKIFLRSQRQSLLHYIKYSLIIIRSWLVLLPSLSFRPLEAAHDDPLIFARLPSTCLFSHLTLSVTSLKPHRKVIKA